MRRPILRPALLVVLLLAIAAPASACINGVHEQAVTEVRLARSAERMLARGRFRRATRIARRALAGVEAQPRGAARRRLHSRLMRLVAVATVRLRGAVQRPALRTPDSMPPAERSANLAWALTELRAGEDAGPVEQALYGEALAAVGRHERAREVLLPLATRDLMPDAFGYVALARALAALGEGAEAERARQGCRAIVPRAQRGMCVARPRS